VDPRSELLELVLEQLQAEKALVAAALKHRLEAKRRMARLFALVAQLGREPAPK
jgi:hypothetical protein